MLLTGPRSFDPAPFDDISFDLCTRRKDVVIMSADLSKYCQVVQVKNELPRQHLDVGMAEQNLLSVAAGVANGGYIPVATCFACYITRRAYDLMMICMGTGSDPDTNQETAPTNIAVGFTPGISNPARIHHQAVEDLDIIAAKIRRNVLEICRQRGGYASQGVAFADITAALYFDELRPDNEGWYHDRFLLSNGHDAIMTYGALAELLDTFDEARATKGKPYVMICDTRLWDGIDCLQKALPMGHYTAKGAVDWDQGAAEIEATLAKLEARRDG